MRFILYFLISIIITILGYCLVDYIKIRKQRYQQYLTMTTNLESPAYKKVIKEYYLNGYLNGPKQQCESKQYVAYKDLPSIPVDQFKRFYSVDPDKWKLEFGCAVRTDDTAAGIVFTPYKNHLKYEKFRKEMNDTETRIKKQKEFWKNQQEHDAKVKIILDYVQEDINRAFKEYDINRQKAIDLTNQVLNGGKK